MKHPCSCWRAVGRNVERNRRVRERRAIERNRYSDGDAARLLILLCGGSGLVEIGGRDDADRARVGQRVRGRDSVVQLRAGVHDSCTTSRLWNYARGKPR